MDARDLINELQRGMTGLSHLQGGMFSDNSNPNLQLQAMESLQKLRQQHNISSTPAPPGADSQQHTENHHVNLRNFANLLREISRQDVVVILERELK